MSTKSVGYYPVATEQNFGSGYDRSSDSQRLVKFVWFPSDPFKAHEAKATLLSSFTVSL